MILNRWIVKNLANAIIFTSCFTCNVPETNAENVSEHQFIFESINSIRNEFDREKLEYSKDLEKIAQGHAIQLARFNVVMHEDPQTGEIYENRIHRSNLMATVALENVGSSRSLEYVMHKFKTSPGHLENIINDRITHVGIGIARKDNSIFVVQDFIRKLKSLSPEDAAREMNQLISEKYSEKKIRALKRNIDIDQKAKIHTLKMIELDKVFALNSGEIGSYKNISSVSPSIALLIHDFEPEINKFTEYGFYIKLEKTTNYPMGVFWATFIFK